VVLAVGRRKGPAAAAEVETVFHRIADRPMTHAVLEVDQFKGAFGRRLIMVSVAHNRGARCSRSTVTTFENGTTTPQPRVLEDLIEVLENAGIIFIEAREGEHGPAVAFKWGIAPLTRQPGEGAGTGEGSEGGAKAAAWDAGLCVPAEIEELRAYWRDHPREWAALSESGRQTLSEKMFGAADAGGSWFGQN
jgi:hypothetical protein